MSFNVNINMGGGMGGGMGQQYVQEPMFQQIAVGQGIDMNEFNSIVNCCKQAYMQQLTPYSQNAGKLIKQYLGAEWFLIVSSTTNKNYDFSITSVEGGDFMSFSLDQTLFQVCKIKGF